MSFDGGAIGGAFALGFALGAAPGPVQMLILSETAKRGLDGGLCVMLGANLTLLGILVVLALGSRPSRPGLVPSGRCRWSAVSSCCGSAASSSGRS